MHLLFVSLYLHLLKSIKGDQGLDRCKYLIHALMTILHNQGLN